MFDATVLTLIGMMPFTGHEVSMNASTYGILAALLLPLGCSEEESVAPPQEAIQASTPPQIRGIPRPQKASIEGMVLTDRIDVGNDADEIAHGYVITQQMSIQTRALKLSQDPAPFVDSLRSTKGSETFQAKVSPWHDHVLVKGFEPSTAGQKLSVKVGDQSAGTWTIEGGKNEYDEASFDIPGDLVGEASQITITLTQADGAEANGFSYWVLAKPAARVVTPIKANVADMSLTDHLDVGDPKSEAAHGYAIDKPLYVGAHDYPWPAGRTVYQESVRSTRSFESFKLKVNPGKEHVLVKSIDTFSKNQKARVFVDNRLIGIWQFPNGPEKYDESTLTIPADVVGNRNELALRFEFIGTTGDMTSLAYWAYATSADVHARN